MTTQLMRLPQPDELLMKADAHGVTISAKDRRLISNKGVRPISTMTRHELVTELAGDKSTGSPGALQYLMRDLGITRPPDAYDGTRFVQVVAEHFPMLTLQDIKSAFEMFVLGELDSWIQDHKFGHYQQFSVQFYTTVLRAYQRRQQQAVHDVRGKVEMKLLEERKPQVNKAQIAIDFARSVLAQFECFVACTTNYIVMPYAVGRFMFKMGLITDEPEVREDDRKVAASKMSKGKDVSVAVAINKALAAGGNDDVENLAKGIAIERAIANVLREQGIEKVREVIQAHIDRLTAKLPTTNTPTNVPSTEDVR